jgi:hypothetical protein
MFKPSMQQQATPSWWHAVFLPSQQAQHAGAARHAGLTQQSMCKGHSQKHLPAYLVHLFLQASATWGELKQDLAQHLPGAPVDELEVLLAYTDQADEGEAA